jgi:hypothetical protein
MDRAQEEIDDSSEISPDPSPTGNPIVKQYVLVKEYKRSKTPIKRKMYLEKKIIKESTQFHSSELTHLSESKANVKKFIINETSGDIVVPDFVPPVHHKNTSRKLEYFDTDMVKAKLSEWSQWIPMKHAKNALFGAIVLGGTAGLYHYSKNLD